MQNDNAAMSEEKLNIIELLLLDDYAMSYWGTL
jgi:hypothetical protein